MAKGFFSNKEVKKKTLSAEPRCMSCGLGGSASEVVGEGRRGILFLTESPSVSTRYTEKVVEKIGLDPMVDCWWTSVLGCSPKKKEVEPTHLDACRPRLHQILRELKPERVVLLGKNALDGFLVDRWHEGLGELDRWRGLTFPDRTFHCWAYPTFHPSFAEQEDKNLVIPSTFRRDIGRVLDPLPPIDWDERLTKQVTILKDPDQINAKLRQFCRGKDLTAFDYETTGIKPYNKKVHAVYTASITSDQLGCFSFPMYPEVVDMWTRFLKSDAPKAAHHLKFEEVWSRTFFKTPVKNWVWCSMEAAHVIDNRPRYCSLKFQAFVHFGWENWSGDVDRYLESGEQDANATNKIKNAPLDSLLLYGGIDSLLQLRLAHRQREILRIV